MSISDTACVSRTILLNIYRLLNFLVQISQLFPVNLFSQRLCRIFRFCPCLNKRQFSREYTLNEESSCENTGDEESSCENALNEESSCENTGDEESSCKNTLNEESSCENTGDEESSCENALNEECIHTAAFRGAIDSSTCRRDGPICPRTWRISTGFGWCGGRIRRRRPPRLPVVCRRRSICRRRRLPWSTRHRGGATNSRGPECNGSSRSGRRCSCSGSQPSCCPPRRPGI